VIAEPCIGVKDRACVDACPVNCIYEGADQLSMHPTEWIDCGACEPECPAEAIFEESSVLSQWTATVRKNAQFFEENADLKPGRGSERGRPRRHGDHGGAVAAGLSGGVNRHDTPAPSHLFPVPPLHGGWG
jgi:NAD-dependent dihydropyrimidine dehydrogenase PreA subunit